VRTGVQGGRAWPRRRRSPPCSRGSDRSAHVGGSPGRRARQPP
jgi:hypothetical protein